MKDRVSLYPGRVKLVPVAGQENVYDMVRADSPTQEGDPLNKNTLLKDATAALLGGDASMLPDEALATLIQLVNSNYSELSSLITNRAKISTGSYVGTQTIAGKSYKKKITFPFEPKLVFVFGDAVAIVPGSNNTYQYAMAILLNPSSNYFHGSINNPTLRTSWGSNYVEFNLQSSNNLSGDPGAYLGLNYSGKTYYWIAIG